MLKRIKTTLLLLLAVGVGHAQSLRLYEYWVDSDYSKHTTVRSSATGISFQMDVSQISKGVHYLNFRAQNSDNDWGSISRYLFYIPEESHDDATLTHYQYWIDNDYSKQKTIATNSGNIPLSVDISNLTSGVHYFNFRARNSDGVWGNLSRYLFYVPETGSAAPSLTHYQYWIDNNYSGQNTTATNSGDITLPIDISNVTTGVHYFNFRARNSDGVWGNLSRFLFYVPETGSAAPTLTHYQYWIDNNFSGQKTTATNSGDITLPIDISNVTTGVHYFNFRARNSDGIWGNLSRYLFYVPENGNVVPSLTKAQYWIDDDFAANVTQNNANGDFFASIDVSQLKSGVHFFNFRACNSDGVWGNLSRYLFYIPDGSTATNNPIVGYRYNFNNTYTYVPLSDRMEYELSNYLIDIPELTEIGSLEEGCTYSFDAGSHMVHFSRTAQVSFAMQFKNKANEWSAPVATQFGMQDAFDKTMSELQVQRQIEMQKVTAGDFQTFYMKLDESRNYFLKSSQSCKIRLYESNGTLLTTIQPEALLSTYQIGLTKGTYYGVVYNTIKDEANPSDVFTLKLMLTDNIVPTPIISYEQEMVSMACAEPTATIYYTLDGTDPTKASTRYSAPFALRHNAVVKAMAVAQDMADSDIATLTVDSYKVATPTIEFTNLKLYMDCQTEEATIFYTLDGSDPTMNGQRYTEPVSIGSNCTAKAVGKRDGYNHSEIAVLTVDVSNVKTSTPEIVREGYGLHITCRTEGATLHYTTDGTTPTANSPTVDNGFLLPQLNGVVKVIAMKNGELPSDVASINVDWLQVTKPVLSYNAESNMLTMTCTTPGATIYYELGGNDPTPASAHGASGMTLTLTDNRVVKAMAMADRLNPSEVAVYMPGSFTVEAVQIAFDGRNLTMSCATEGATIHYALSDGLTGSGVYSTPIIIEQLGTVFAWAEKANMNSSDRIAFTIESCFDGHIAHSTAGKLSSAFEWCGTDNVQVLTADGSIDETDLTFLRSMPALLHLDLSKASMKSDHLPAGAFASMPLLSIAVPNKLSSAGNGLFRDCLQLAAITWNPSLRLTEQMLSGFENPNLLLYVKIATDAPTSVKNVVTNGVASSITLIDASGNNNFYCPTPFTAKHISYLHNYTMSTVTGVCRGWETICLPFQVSSITHEKKGELAPFAAHNDSAKPFWLCSLTGSGFESTARIEAYRPYIISMPNNPDYADSYIIGGNVTFEGENVTIAETPLESYAGRYANKTMLGTFTTVPKTSSMLVLNVGEEFNGYAEGSAFFRDLNRETRPFHAYVVEDGAASRIFAIGEATITGIEDVTVYKLSEGMYYDLQGRSVGKNHNSLKRGVYIKDGRKMLVK